METDSLISLSNCKSVSSMATSINVTSNNASEVQQALLTSSDQAPSVQSMTAGGNLLQDSDEVRVKINLQEWSALASVVVTWTNFSSLFLSGPPSISWPERTEWNADWWRGNAVTELFFHCKLWRHRLLKRFTYTMIIRFKSFEVVRHKFITEGLRNTRPQVSHTGWYWWLILSLTLIKCSSIVPLEKNFLGNFNTKLNRVLSSILNHSSSTLPLFVRGTSIHMATSCAALATEKTPTIYVLCIPYNLFFD